MDKSHVELSESLEDYLVAIYELSRDHGNARSAAIADRLDVSTASVTNALRALADRKLINYERYQAVTLTPDGGETAAQVARRKRILERFFVDVLHLDDEEAAQNAHRIEHMITPRALDRLLELLNEPGVSPETPGRPGQWRG
jgi:DtxR family Mn-dependent transcriptional regulator